MAAFHAGGSRVPSMLGVRSWARRAHGGRGAYGKCAGSPEGVTGAATAAVGGRWRCFLWRCFRSVGSGDTPCGIVAEHDPKTDFDFGEGSSGDGPSR
jgi:hypothetical protein